MNITITLTPTQASALAFVALSPQEWAENVVNVRCHIAIEEIVQIVMTQCLDNGEQLPTTREAIVAYGYECGAIQSVEDRQAALELEPADLEQGV